MRPLIAMLAVFALSATATAQTPSAVTRGSALRITTAPILDAGVGSRRVVGNFSHFQNDTVYLNVGSVGAAPQYYAVKNIQSVEHSASQRHPYASKTLAGFTFGTVVGYMAYRLTRKIEPAQYHCFESGNSEICQEVSPATQTGHSAIFIGMGAGAVVGFVWGAKTLQPAWKPISIAELRGR